MKDLYLHIGMNKTGTSTLQSLMSENRPLLQNEGILYPETGCRGEAHYGFSMALGLGNRPKRGPKIPDIAELLGKLEEEGQKTQCRKIVISSECFVLSRNPSEIKKAFAEYRVSVIVYLRPHVEWLVSLYNQALKTVSHPPWGGNFEEYLLFHYMRTPYFRYLDFLLLWENAFGRNSMIVRPFQNKQFMDSDLKADFLNQFDARHLKDTLSTKKGEILNQSVPHDRFKALDAVQRLRTLPEETKDEIISSLINTPSTIAKEDDKTVILPRKLRTRIEAANRLDYQEIGQRYLGQKSLFIP